MAEPADKEQTETPAPKQIFFFPELGLSVEASSMEEAKKLTGQKK